MAVKVFLTGATGYIGGSAFAGLHKAHPDWEYSLLVRSEEKAQTVKAKYPNVNFIIGGLDDDAILQKAAAEADLVVHTADSADHLASAVSITKGLEQGHSAEKPGYYIHLSGTGILIFDDLEKKRYGEAPLPDQKYDDLEGIERILNLPDSAIHRDVEKVVRAANSDSVKIAFITPPTIYGPGSGPGNTESIQIPALTQATLEKGFAPIVGVGKTEWDQINVSDLSDLFVLLADASQDSTKKTNPDIFGQQAYFFAENGYFAWSDVATWIAEEASRQGYLPEPLTKSVKFEEIAKAYHASSTWGLNSKAESKRAKKLLGWQPKGASIKDTLPALVTLQAKSLGLTPKDKN